MNEDIREKIIKAVTEERKSIRDVASKLFITEKQLRELLQSWGVQTRTRTTSKVPMPNRETLMRLYREHKTTKGVGDFYGVSVNKVNKWMKELNIPARRMKMKGEERIKFLEEHVKRFEDLKL